MITQLSLRKIVYVPSTLQCLAFRNFFYSFSVWGGKRGAGSGGGDNYVCLASSFNIRNHLSGGGGGDENVK